MPGPVRLWPHQKGIADAICSPAIEKIVVQKAARTGYSLLLGGVIGSYIANAPAPVLCIVPTDQDAKNFVTDQLESVFDASPALRGKLSGAKRNRLLYRQFPGGWLRVVAAKAPRNLRAHTAKVVVFDEIDAFDISAGGTGGEGDPISLGIRRSDTFADRKIILGGTPIDVETSAVIREFNASNMQVFEIPCLHCGALFELEWDHIRWDEGNPETARAECPHCSGRIYESEKASIVSQGQWRALRPEITNVAGFRLSALIAAGNPAAAWPKLAAEFIKAKRSPLTLKPFINTVLGRGWEHREGAGLDEHKLAKLAEPFDLEKSMPPEVRVLCAGVDVQGWGLCVLTVGFSADQIFVLDYRDLHGDPLGDEVWKDLDAFTRRRFPHAFGRPLGFDSVAVDSGDGNTTAAVYAWTRARFGRRCISTKGHDGNRNLIEKSNKPGLYTLGVDTGKSRIFDMLEGEGHIRFSQSLPARFYDELCAERKITVEKYGHPKFRWHKTSGMRNEGLDCLVMALGAREILHIDLVERENHLRGIATAPRTPTIIRSRWMTQGRE